MGLLVRVILLLYSLQRGDVRAARGPGVEARRGHGASKHDGGAETRQQTRRLPQRGHVQQVHPRELGKLQAGEGASGHGFYITYVGSYVRCAFVVSGWSCGACQT